jgi:UDP-2-acetamido-2,6-beta-L-arabino-hexul-4-ose reductase
LRELKKHEDDRGWLIETVKADSGGQCFISTTKSGVTRGNHFHRRKVERFIVLQGNAQIKIRKLFTDEVIVYEIDGETPVFIDMPTLHTHSITNVGETELITMFWTDEIYDPESSDTYFEEVEL